MRLLFFEQIVILVAMAQNDTVNTRYSQNYLPCWMFLQESEHVKQDCTESHHFTLQTV